MLARRLGSIAALLFWGSTLVTSGGCGNECSFFERCSGNTLQRCGDGVDQVAGRKVRDFPCEQPNGACVELSGSDAMCVVSPELRCDEATFAQRCDGTLAVRCASGYQVAEDCTRDGPDCVLSGGDALCAVSPLEPCDDSFVGSCDGDVRVYCTRATGGVVAREDCTVKGYRCIEGSNRSGSTYRYCGRG